MCKSICIFCFLIFPVVLLGQKAWTLRECIDHAIKHNIKIKQQEIIVKKAEIELQKSKNNRLPNLNVGTGQSFNFGRSQSMETGIYENLQTSSTSVAASSSISLFSGFGLANNIKVNRFNLLASIEGLEKIKDNLEIQIASLYLEILFKKELLDICKIQADVTAKQVERTVTLVQSGKVPQSQLLDIKAQAAKNEVNTIEAQNSLDMALLNLAQALNINDKDFDIARLEQEGRVPTELMDAEFVYKEAIDIRPQVKEATYRLEESRKAIKVAQAGYWPSLSLGLSYTSGFSQTLSRLDDYGFAGAFTQFKNNQRQAIGINLNIPIYTKGQVRNQVKIARFNLESQAMELENVKSELFKEIQQAAQLVVAARAKYNATTKAVQAFAESFYYAKERYDLGKQTVYELSDAQAKLMNSESEKSQAKYELLFRIKILDFYRGKRINL